MKNCLSLLFFVIFFSCSVNQFDKDILNFEVRLVDERSKAGLPELNVYASAQKFFVGDSVFLQNKHILSADVIDRDSQPKVKVRLTDEGRILFADFTRHHVGRQAAILVDQKLISAPRINAAINEGILLIVGFFSLEEAISIAEGIVPRD